MFYIYIVEFFYVDWVMYFFEDNVIVIFYRMGVRVLFGFYNLLDDVVWFVVFVECGFIKGI